MPAVPDAAPLAACPVAFPAPPSLAPLQPFLLPDGRQAVLLEAVTARDAATAHFIIEGRGAWHECRSAVTYVEDWTAAMTAERNK